MNVKTVVSFGWRRAVAPRRLCCGVCVVFLSLVITRGLSLSLAIVAPQFSNLLYGSVQPRFNFAGSCARVLAGIFCASAGVVLTTCGGSPCRLVLA